MAGRKHTAEQIIAILRQIEVALGNGKKNPLPCREAGITEQTYYRWRKGSGMPISLLAETSTPSKNNGLNCGLENRRKPI
jgi:Transposase